MGDDKRGTHNAGLSSRPVQDNHYSLLENRFTSREQTEPIPTSIMPNKAQLCCKSVILNFCIVSSPIGNMKIISCPGGLHSVGQDGDISDKTFSPDLSVKVEKLSSDITSQIAENSPIEMCVTWLKNYFDGSSSGSISVPLPPLCLSPAEKAAFRGKVWLTLASKVGAGRVVSYGDLAILVDNPRACQAVGSAMSHNPFQLLVPCHRVIRGDSTLGSYAHGTLNSVKKWLLNYEGVTQFQ